MQPIEVKPAQLPLKVSTTASKLAEPATNTFISVEVAVNLYHTSALAVPKQSVIERVAPLTVPEIALQVAPVERAIAPPQLSFDGEGFGVVTQMLKLGVLGKVPVA